MDPLSLVVDEVSLEGLDGITIPTLWIRLEDRNPKFPLKLDDCTKEFIWSSLVNNNELTFYELPQNRDDVELDDRFQDIDPETGIETKECFETKKDIYPVQIILENKAGIQGSCIYFKERKDVTKHIRSQSNTPLITLDGALKRYNRKLVVVASQKLRFRTLIGSESDPDLKLSDDSYCVLERVGRARWQGELQRDLHVCSFKIDARKLHYLRKSLVRHGLITIQSHVTRVRQSRQQQHSILLLLKRFHVNRRSKYDILMEQVSTFLQRTPGQFTTLVTLREHLNVDDRTFKRVYQYMRAGKLADLCRVPMEEVDPSSGPCKTKRGRDKLLVRCLKMVKPYSKKGVADDDDDDDDEDDDESGARRGPFTPEGRIMERDVLSQAYDIIVASGTKGIAMRALGCKMNVGKLESRMICRKLEREGVIKGFMEDVGRQRITKFISHKSVSIKLQFSSIVPVSSSDKSRKSLERSHETYRLLRRKNMIVEAVHDAKVIDGLFPLQKMINEKEKEDGMSSKCCKKTILRLVQTLSREGLVKFYTTTVIQDGVSKKVLKHIALEQFIIESHTKLTIKGLSVTTKNKYGSFDNRPSRSLVYTLVTMKGLGKSLGFQPKMHRLRVVHNFLWHMIYGHPLRNSSQSTLLNSSESNATTESSDAPQSITQSSEDDDAMSAGHSQSEMTVYSDEDSWKKYIPPIRVNKDYGSGWAMVGDLLLCLPLSVFIQVIQINYQVDGLEEYLNDTEKQHYLVRSLPSKMRRQLLYKRRYIFNFHENLQKLAYMGLIQFGPVEKFKDKDQVYVYVKCNATIVDTTNAEPHYWLVTESPDKPFERRQYTFNTAEDTENYWFDLMCVCLNTPLVVKTVCPCCQVEKGGGSRDVCDDGSIPGDGKGAGGLDSEFFAHLKRNWLWTNHLLAVKTVCMSSTKEKCICAVSVAIEPASRNQQVVGGRRQKRKRTKKEVVKVPRKKKKEPKKRTPAHDEADHKALKLMTRQRVYWSVQEDSLMMLCSVASHLLNSKLKRPFVPYCVVRDLLHAEFEKSRDKTSLATGRRTRYILKNPQTLLNYRICLAEAHQDKHLMRLLDENNPADPDKPEDCSKAFLEYTKLLRQKFSSAMNSSESILTFILHRCKLHFLPNIKTDFNLSGWDRKDRSSQRSLTHNKHNKDIHAIVLCNLIQSTLAMTNSQMKNSRSFQTFHMYSQYNQELLCQVFIHCRKRGLVNRRRVSKMFGPKKNRALPILPMSYQLSQSYFRYLQSFSFRFPHTLCTDTFRFLRTLLNTSPGPDESLDVSNLVQFSLDFPGGACAAALSLMTLGLVSVHMSIPKQMVVVDSTLVDNDVVKSMATLEDEDDDDDDGEECEGRKRLQVKAHQASHTNYLMMRGYCSPGIVKLRNLNTTDNIVVESCIMRLQLRNSPAHHMFTKLRFSPFLSSASSQTAEERDGRLIEQKGYTRQDTEVCARIRRSLDEAGDKGVDVQDFKEAHRDLEEPRSGRTRSLQRYMQDLVEEGEVLQVGAVGARWVLMQHAQPWLLTIKSNHWSQSRLTPEGLPLLDNQHRIPFMRKRNRRGAQEGTEETEETPAKKAALDENQDEKAGSENTSEKLNEEEEQKEGADEERGEEEELKRTQPEKEDKMQTETRQEKVRCFPGRHSSDSHFPFRPHSENMSFISRPWRMVDGKLNRQVCKGMMEAVLYHIMSHPGILQDTLLQHYKDVLQPMAVLDLVQALIDMGCVKKKTLRKTPKPSLFSRFTHQVKSDTEVKSEEPDAVFYEPTICCCLRLSRVLPNERHWNSELP
uniref:Uncharacterized protein n=1 Tax=Sphaeramia orbicularis TaxID=375764 RepID=A0A672YIJ2_9TELE